MKQPTIIFDFDGTIADTHSYIIQISNHLAVEFKFQQIHPRDVSALKDKTSQEIVSLLKIPLLKIPRILKRAKEEFHKNIESVALFPGLDETFKTMKAAGVQLGILSSNAPENIHRVLRDHNMDVFDFIDTTKHVWSKNLALRRLMHKHHLATADVIYVGDETRDVAAAHRIGVRVAAVTWGYNSQAALEKHNPTYLIHRPQDLLTLCHPGSTK